LYRKLACLIKTEGRSTAPKQYAIKYVYISSQTKEKKVENENYYSLLFSCQGDAKQAAN